MFEFIKKLFNNNNNNNNKRISDEEFNLNKKYRIDKINKILDKISEKGYSCLTKKEIDFLNKNK